jgi:16S rRNA (uracil1498-N3)-methyltransferase
MTPRLFVDQPLCESAVVGLPEGAARHVQVLRLQPGDGLTLFNGLGGQWDARVMQMARREVQVQVGTFSAIERELALPVTLAIGMPGNERMDGLVEKATELGATLIQPLLSSRSVLRLAGGRAERKVAHWQAVAVAACEQCGRNRVPVVAPVGPLAAWLEALPAADGTRRLLLSPNGPAMVAAARGGPHGTLLLSGPEGGLTAAEEEAALARGFAPLSLGPRILRADTAPLAALAWLSGPSPGPG